MRLLLVGDGQPVLHDLRMSLSQFEWIELCGEAEDEHAAIAMAVGLQPAVIVMASGPEDTRCAGTIREIRRISPRTEIVVLSQNDDPIAKKEVLDAGAAVCIPRSAAWTSLMSALRELECSTLDQGPRRKS